MREQNTHRGLAGITILLILFSSGCYGIIGSPPSNQPNTPTSKNPQPGVPGKPVVRPPVPRNGADAGPSTTPDQGKPQGPPDVTRPDIPSVPILQCSISSPDQLRRLTRIEYKYTVKDLLGAEVDVEKIFPPDENTFGFSVGEGVNLALSQGYMKASEQITEKLNLDNILPCKTSAGDDNCAKKFIASFAPKAYRRPLTTEEADRLFQLFQKTKSSFGFSTGIKITLQYILQSPHFIYRVEKGTAPDPKGIVKLSGLEIASRLSYFLWKSAPDQTLLDAATAGKLTTLQEIETQTRRMLTSEKAKRTIQNFFYQWLHLEKLDNLSKNEHIYPTFNKDLVNDMRQETEKFINHVVWEGDGKFQTLLTASYSFLNQRLATHYGVLGVQGTELKKINMNPAQRAGLFTQGSILSIHSLRNQSSPIHRGLFVRKALFCQIPPPPPDDVIAKPPEVDPNTTTRERFEQHRKDPKCSGCHQLLDPLGFGFEHFDAIGRYRTKDGKFDVDAKGHFYATDIDGPFYGTVEMAKKIATSGQAQECFVRQWFRYTFSREETPADECFIQSVSQKFKDSSHNIRELLVAITQHTMFSYLKGDFKDKATIGSQSSPLTAGTPTGIPTEHKSSQPSTPSVQGCSIASEEHRAPASFFFFSCVLAFIFFARKRR